MFSVVKIVHFKSRFEEMSFTESYPDLLCASSNNHIVKHPITLACSHIVCKSCIPKFTTTIKCQICGINQNFTAHENYLIKTLIEKSLPGLFDSLEKRMSDEIRKYKGKLR